MIIIILTKNTIMVEVNFVGLIKLRDHMYENKFKCFLTSNFDQKIQCQINTS